MLRGKKGRNMIGICFALSTLLGMAGIGWYSPKDAPKIFFTGVFIISLATLGFLAVM